MPTFRDYTFLGTTQSICPDCLALVPAKVISRGERVYFRKTCTRHGIREDFICSDAAWFDLKGYSLPGKLPKAFGVTSDKGCPYDCGLCSEHEQHTCIGLLEINSACNLECPMCFAVSGPSGSHLSVDDCIAAIDRLVELEGQPEILQLSGGEPTIHPQFEQIHRYACEQPIDIVMINTNGIRIARDRAFLERIAEQRHRTEIYLQFDTFEESANRQLRGAALLEMKLRAVEMLGEVGLNTILVCTVQAGVNEHEIGRLVNFGIDRPWITGVSFQPATYSGRSVLPESLESRITFPDVIRAVVNQSTAWQESDFSPLPCAHPNAHTLSYAFRRQNRITPMARFISFEQHLDLLSGRITFNRERARELIEVYLSRQCCGGGNCDPFSHATAESQPRNHAQTPAKDVFGSVMSEETRIDAAEFFTRALSQTLQPRDMFRITTTSFMDVYNFDIRQLMKECVHFVLPSGHVVPFSAYNVLYRNGHVPLPPLVHATARS